MDSAFNIDRINSTGGNAVLGADAASYGDNQFLQLLTQQLRNQTPFEPVDSESFNTQLASYSNMEEQRELNSNMLKLLDYQGLLARSQGLSQGSTLLGKTVEYVQEDGTAGAAQVASVFVAETGDVRLRLQNGEEIDLRSVLGITQEAGGSGSSSGGEPNPTSGGSNTSDPGGGSSGSGSSGSGSGGGTTTQTTAPGLRTTA
ncbi:MAG: flagellar hook capping FlgD N-terminal domain-containing protein [Planctomycetota bacterium]